MSSRLLAARAVSGATLALTASACSPNYSFQTASQSQLEAPPTYCKPVIGDVAPTENKNLRWKWADGPHPNYNQLMAPVMVADINGDGTSDFVFVPFRASAYTSTGPLRVVSGADGKEIWSTNAATPVDANQVLVPAAGEVVPLADSNLAIYDLDGDGKPEILVNANRSGTTGLAIYSSTGALRGFSPLTTSYSSLLAVSDLKGDGNLFVQVSTKLYPLDKATMTLGAAAALPGDLLAITELVENSPGQEIVTSAGVYSANLAKLYSLPRADTSPLYVAFGGFHGGKQTDIALVFRSPLTVLTVNGADGTKLAEWTESADDQAACAARTGRTSYSVSGAPNVGDFDGDGVPDISLAGACKFYALKVVPSSISMLWSFVSRDFSSAVTGSSVYDFNGDGKVEVLYNDELYFRIFDGKSGQVLYQLANDSGTLYEYPTVVSLRKNEPASIVLAANSYGKYIEAISDANGNPVYEDPENGIRNVTGVRVVQSADASWMKTRSIWNQFTYTITNVLDDLQVPSAIADFVGLSNRTRANVPDIQHPCTPITITL